MFTGIYGNHLWIEPEGVKCATESLENLCLGLCHPFVSYDFLDPVPVVGDSGVDARCSGLSALMAPGNRSHQCPMVSVKAHQRRTRVTLKGGKIKGFDIFCTFCLHKHLFMMHNNF